MSDQSAYPAYALMVEFMAYTGLRVKGQSSPEEVACGVFVGLGGVSACLATKFRLGDAILRCCVPAFLAAVGAVPGVDRNPGA